MLMHDSPLRRLCLLMRTLYFYPFCQLPSLVFLESADVADGGFVAVLETPQNILGQALSDDA